MKKRKKFQIRKKPEFKPLGKDARYLCLDDTTLDKIVDEFKTERGITDEITLQDIHVEINYGSTEMYVMVEPSNAAKAMHKERHNQKVAEWEVWYAANKGKIADELELRKAEDEIYLEERKLALLKRRADIENELKKYE